MTAGVSPVSPVTSVGPASRLQFDATPIAPAAQRAAIDPKSLPPSVNDPNIARPRGPGEGIGGFSMMV